ncbi:MAG: urea transporter [Bacteroidia bacterium]|nr:urea transporter [Bacteroidia bacterium]
MRDFSLKNIISGILNSYSQIFFSDKRLFAIILMLVTFFDWFAGLCGLLSVLASIALAYWLGFDRYKIGHGYYSFNSLLVGLGIGIAFSPSIQVILILLVISALCFFITILLETVIGKYYLPYLSIPFLIALWVITLSSREFHSLVISDRGLYKLNELYTIGGSSLVDMYVWWTNLEIVESLRVYFISLGAIFFQYNMLAGLLIAIGLLYYSRIAFSLSLINFYTAYFFYELIGARLADMNYNYIGFNYILTGIAIGGFFLIPSRLSYLWSVLLVPVVTVITISFSKIFGIFQLFIFSLPFNFVVLLFIYVIKVRLFKSPILTEPYVQQGSPEVNLYSFQNTTQRFRNAYYFPIKLPFWGEWHVTQGHNGKHTHKDDWKHAWDFEILDSDQKPFKSSGHELEDYYCYDKLVLAPAAGYVVHIVDGVEDNKINDVNTTDNWGNTIIIKHAEFLHTKLCHLKTGSFKVYIGEYVRQGQAVAHCGNSGRSPYPHLHFQIQSTPYIGSKTLDYPISYYINRNDHVFELESFSKPVEKQVISNIEVNTLLTKAFHFIPGQKLNWEVHFDCPFDNASAVLSRALRATAQCDKSQIRNQKSEITEWEIYTDINNNSYMYCRDTNSYAYFVNDGYIFYFSHFTGDKTSLLYYFFLAFYKIQFGYYKNLKMTDIYPIHLLVNKAGLFLQDFIAPFYIFIKACYTLEYSTVDNDLSPSLITLKSQAETLLFSKRISLVEFNINISEKGISKFIIKNKNKEIEAKCIS